MSENCQIPGCQHARHARGLCITHYSRHRKGRDLFGKVRSPLSGTAAERLMAGMEPDTNGGCWLWQFGANNFGYGTVYFEGRLWKAHRLAFETWCNPILAGMEVCHRCDTPACINPAHLFLGIQPIPFIDRNWSHCAWPVGGEGAEMLCCGAQRDGEGPYCGAHHRSATQAVRPGSPRTASELARSLRRYVA